jgi:hypothetical protein
VILIEGECFMTSQQHSFSVVGNTVHAKIQDRGKRETGEPAVVDEISGVTDGDPATLFIASKHQKIAARAQRYWQERGCPEGSAQEDWFRAERDMYNEFRVASPFERDPLGLPH